MELMSTISVLVLASFSDALLADGSKIEANHGENVTLPFTMYKAEEADRLRIIFTSETTKASFLIAQRCSDGCNVVNTPGVSLRVGEGRVSVSIEKVNSSRSGLYKVQAFFGKDVSKMNATLIVNDASFSSSPAPPHSSTPKPLNSSEHQGLYAVIALVIIVISGVVCFCKLRRKGESAADGEGSRETVLLSSDPVSPKERNGKNDCGDCVVVDMNGCGEDPEALLASENT